MLSYHCYSFPQQYDLIVCLFCLLDCLLVVVFQINVLILISSRTGSLLMIIARQCFQVAMKTQHTIWKDGSHPCLILQITLMVTIISLRQISMECLIQENMPLIQVSTSALQGINAVCALIDFMQLTFFYLGRFQKKLADNLCSSITKSSI